MAIIKFSFCFKLVCAKQSHTGWTCSASSTYNSDTGCENVLDENYSDTWATVHGQGVGAFIDIIFQKPLSVNRIRFLQRKHMGKAIAYISI